MIPAGARAKSASESKRLHDAHENWLFELARELAQHIGPTKFFNSRRRITQQVPKYRISVGASEWCGAISATWQLANRPRHPDMHASSDLRMLDFNHEVSLAKVFVGSQILVAH